jgi:C1A family cysteine protease
VRDWTGVYTTPVRDQGSCGSCWAFAAVVQVESDAIRLFGFNKDTFLSTQQVTSCDKVDGGCNGGNTETAFDYIKTNGLMYETAYPYTSGAAGVTGTCKAISGTVVGLTAYYLVSSSTIPATIESAMANYVLNIGPLAICLAADSFSSYTTGIMSVCTGAVNHCVQAVGVNIGASTPYWIVSKYLYYMYIYNSL